MASLLLKFLPYLRRLSFLEFLQGYRTYVAGVALLWTGVIGLVFGAVPIPGGEGITWTPLSPQMAWGSLIGGLTALGLGGKLDNIIKKGDESMKKFIFAFLILSAFLVVATSGFAWDFNLVDDWKAIEATGFVLESGDANGQLSGGVFYGPWAELKSDAGKRVLGFGGVTGNIKSDDHGGIRGAIGMTLMTAFDDMIQTSVVVDPADFKWSEPDAYMFMIGVSPIKAGSWVIDKGAALLGTLLH